MAVPSRSLISLTGCSMEALSTHCRPRFTATPITSLRVDRVPFCRRELSEQARFYATLKSRGPRSPKNPKNPKTPGLTPKSRSNRQAWTDIQRPAVLTLEHAATSDMETFIKAAGFRHRPDQYIDCTEKFSSVADRGDHTWPYLLDEDERPSPQLMHETACLLSALKIVDSTGVTAVALWAGASELGHIPSTLTLRLSFRHTRAKQLAHPLLRPVDNRFRALVAASHPQAVAIQGMLLADDGQTNAAIATIERALALDPDEAYAVWRTGCHGVLGEAYVKVGRTDEARTHLNRAVDQRMARYAEPLAKLVDNEDEAWRLMFQAACVKPSLFSYLAEDELRRADKLSSKDDKDMAYKMAAEWSRLAELDAK